MAFLLHGRLKNKGPRAILPVSIVLVDVNDHVWRWGWGNQSVAFGNFCGVKTPIMTDLRLLSWSQSTLASTESIAQHSIVYEEPKHLCIFLFCLFFFSFRPHFPFTFKCHRDLFIRGYLKDIFSLADVIFIIYSCTTLFLFREGWGLESPKDSSVKSIFPPGQHSQSSCRTLSVKSKAAQLAPNSMFSSEGAEPES